MSGSSSAYWYDYYLAVIAQWGHRSVVEAIAIVLLAIVAIFAVHFGYDAMTLRVATVFPPPPPARPIEPPFGAQVMETGDVTVIGTGAIGNVQIQNNEKSLNSGKGHGEEK